MANEARHAKLEKFIVSRPWWHLDHYVVDDWNFIGSSLRIPALPCDVRYLSCNRPKSPKLHPAAPMVTSITLHDTNTLSFCHCCAYITLPRLLSACSFNVGVKMRELYTNADYAHVWFTGRARNIRDWIKICSNISSRPGWVGVHDFPALARPNTSQMNWRINMYYRNWINCIIAVEIDLFLLPLFLRCHRSKVGGRYVWCCSRWRLNQALFCGFPIMLIFPNIGDMWKLLMPRTRRNHPPEIVFKFVSWTPVPRVLIKLHNISQI